MGTARNSDSGVRKWLSPHTATLAPVGASLAALAQRRGSGAVGRTAHRPEDICCRPRLGTCTLPSQGHRGNGSVAAKVKGRSEYDPWEIWGEVIRLFCLNCGDYMTAFLKTQKCTPKNGF